MVFSLDHPPDPIIGVWIYRHVEELLCLIYRLSFMPPKVMEEVHP